MHTGDSKQRTEVRVITTKSAKALKSVQQTSCEIGDDGEKYILLRNATFL